MNRHFFVILQMVVRWWWYVMMRTEAKAAIVVDAKRKWGFDGIGMDWDQKVPQAWHRMNFRPQFPAAA